MKAFAGHGKTVRRVTEGMRARDMAGVAEGRSATGAVAICKISIRGCIMKTSLRDCTSRKKYVQELLLEQFQCRYYRCSVLFIKKSIPGEDRDRRNGQRVDVHATFVRRSMSAMTIEKM